MDLQIGMGSKFSIDLKFGEGKKLLFGFLKIQTKLSNST